MSDLFGITVVESDMLPIKPSPGTWARRYVRHGMADILEWLGEDVGPEPDAETHVLRKHVCDGPPELAGAGSPATESPVDASLSGFVFRTGEPRICFRHLRQIYATLRLAWMSTHAWCWRRWDTRGSGGRWPPIATSLPPCAATSRTR